MYFLYLTSAFFLFFIPFLLIKNYVFKPRKYETFENIKKYEFIIKSLELCQENKILELGHLDNFKFKNKLELDKIYNFKFYIINYFYNGDKYKYYSNSNDFKFPIYTQEEIKNYVYLNKITKAEIVLNLLDKHKSYNKIIDILDLLLPFVGPNYNFYCDLDIKLNYVDIIKYFKIHHNKNNMFDEIDFINKNFYIKLNDNFDNEYIFNDYILSWNPELKL